MRQVDALELVQHGHELIELVLFYPAGVGHVQMLAVACHDQMERVPSEFRRNNMRNIDLMDSTEELCNQMICVGANRPQSEQIAQRQMDEHVGNAYFTQ